MRFFYKLLGDTDMQVEMRAQVLNLWIRGPRCLISKPTLGWHSFLLRWSIGADNGTKRLCPCPHPRVEPVYLGLPRARKTFPGLGCGRRRDYKVMAFSQIAPRYSEACSRKRDGAFWVRWFLR